MKRTPLKRQRTDTRRRTTEQTADYVEARSVAAGRSYGACQADGFHATGCTGQGQVAHHIRRRSKGGPDHPDNLLWVHPNCHARIHSHPNDARQIGYLA